MLAAGGSLRGAWEGLGLGWSFDDLRSFLNPGLEHIPEAERGDALGLIASTAMAAVEQDRDRNDDDAGPRDGTFRVQKREQGVVAPFGGDRLWGTINGENYCVLISHDLMHRDLVKGEQRRWHISVSNERHLRRGHDVPTWRDFVAIVHQLRPGVAFVVGIPPRNMWMNKNPNVLHAVEVRDEVLMAEWRRNAEQVQGTDAAVPS